MGRRIEQFRSAFNGLTLTRYSLSAADLAEVAGLASRLGLPLADALAPLKRECLTLLSRQLALAKQDGVITDAEANELRELQTKLCLTDAEAGPIRRELHFLRTVQGIRAGKLDPVRTSLVLPPGETCYHDAPALYHKVLQASIRVMDGRLILTNQKVRFISDTGGFDFPLSKVANVSMEDANGIQLSLTRNQGAGYYQVGEPALVVEILNFLLNRHHRTTSVQQAGSRSIPQEVKAEVFARDGGVCVQCGAGNYIEFDHVIPFSMGGASTPGNLQLLCRECNLKKGARL